MTRTILCTPGDISGIGPEVLGKALQIRLQTELTTAFVLLYPKALIPSSDLRFKSIQKLNPQSISNLNDLSPGIYWIDPFPPLQEIPIAGHPTSETADISYLAVEKAILWCMDGLAQGMVTGPIFKKGWKDLGHPYPGHTEMLAEMSDTRDFAMAFASPSLNIVLATTHLPLRDVAGALTTQGIYTKLRLAHEFGKQLTKSEPHIALTGLNPHAGENGQIGDEEISILKPAIDLARSDGILIDGPFAADTLFYHVVNHHSHDVIVCLYHDQALAPLKTLHFHDAVNVTLGLPFIRTSPDHGTAFDIAGQNKANPSSTLAAICLAENLI